MTVQRGSLQNSRVGKALYPDARSVDWPPPDNSTPGGVDAVAARQPHKLEDAGSTPAPATYCGAVKKNGDPCKAYNNLLEDGRCPAHSEYHVLD